MLYDLRPPFVSAPRLTSFSRLILPAYGRNIATTHRRMDPIDSYTSLKTAAPVEYMPLEDIEKPDRYRPGGYHPISIGDCLSGRYDVVHKLGFGTYSTTWLARGRDMKKYVAIKIAIADADVPESKIFDTLALSEPSDEGHPGEALIPRVLDTFSRDVVGGILFRRVYYAYCVGWGQLFYHFSLPASRILIGGRLTIEVIDMVYRLATQAEDNNDQLVLYGCAAISFIEGSE